MPFGGEWYTINGGVTQNGVTQNTSYSWEVLPQRFTYDYAIVDDKGESCFGDKKDLCSYYCYGKIYLLQQTVWLFHRKQGFRSRIMDNGQTDPDISDIAGNRIIMKHPSK